MHCKGLILGIGLGMVAGAVAVMMLPSNCMVRKIADKAADKMEDAAWRIGDKMCQEFDM